MAIRTPPPPLPSPVQTIVRIASTACIQDALLNGTAETVLGQAGRDPLQARLSTEGRRLDAAGKVICAIAKLLHCHAPTRCPEG